MVTLNTTTATQNTTTLPNIFNLTSQLMRTITEATAGGSNQQNNATSNVNTGGGYFSHFETVGANPVEGFGAFRNNNNNNPLLPSLPLPLSGFGEGLGGGFNPLPEGNAGGLDSNVAALVNALTGANLGINHIDRESN